MPLPIKFSKQAYVVCAAIDANCPRHLVGVYGKSYNKFLVSFVALVTHTQFHAIRRSVQFAYTGASMELTHSRT